LQESSVVEARAWSIKETPRAKSGSEVRNMIKRQACEIGRVGKKAKEILKI
jgi:hypothetical protein